MNSCSYKSLKCLCFSNKEGTEEENESIKKVVILLHGYGSDAKDLISIAPSFKNLENTLFIAANAPYEIEGFVGKQWFSLITKENDKGGFDVEIASPNEVKIASALIVKLINEVKEYHNLEYKDISLLGFSQGGILALYTALHSDMELDAVISHSGVYFGDNEESNYNQRILMIHGEDDEVLPLERFNLTVEFFKQKNIPFESHVEKKLPHSINANTIEICENFLLKNNLHTEETGTTETASEDN
ncbi:MAG: dienelactone hydrolase family protein [Alphaproteobacteria bacterium]|jgi:phospholipase/carboxylesterase|nr:dienelactone hydrolase family protein [Alphaproteobacteria bacterium]